MRLLSFQIIVGLAFGANLDLAGAEPILKMINPEGSTAQQKAASCIACHGEHGVSLSPIWPNLAGQKKAYLIKQMKAFRDGPRFDPMMTPLSKQYSDTEIEELAEYFSGIQCKN